MNNCVELYTADCQELVKRLNTAKKDMVILIVGEMSIEYLGRAASYAYPATRLLLIKPDGTLLVHESARVEPLNWQPPKSTIHFECIENALRVRAIRENPREEVIVEFINIDFANACRLALTKLTVVGRESDIVKVVLQNPSIIEEGAVVIGSDVSTPYGKVDVLLKKGDKVIVVEVKNEKAGIQAIMQLKRYVDYYSSRERIVEGVLVAPGISQDAFMLLNKEGFRFIDFRTLKSRTGEKTQTLEKFFKIAT
uniref:Endonuclease NucS n=1 Tax=Ignisphaera aggregans TaxID=334771 RepID=A0A7C2ZPJ6_9CREN